MSADFAVRAKIDDREINLLIAALRKTGKEAGMAEKDIQKLEQAARNTGRQGSTELNKINTSLNGMTKTVGNAAKGFIAFLAVDKLKDFAVQVTKVTGQFQRLEAVLVNALGSRSQAQKALNEIKTLAETTPFSVAKLTESYVKLVNSGFIPTQKEITKLGDLSSSTGKDIIQLTEAIIDAQVGEFERLKEFGIRASKEGDKVTFTFKGVKQQVDFTQESIQQYILGLGDAAGVSGAMASISQTLEGKISNLGDTYDALLLNLGSSNGAISEAIELTSRLLTAINQLISTPYSETLIQQRTELQTLVTVLIENNKNEELRSTIITELNQKYPEFLKNLDQEKVTTERLKDRLKELNNELERKILVQLQEEANAIPLKNLIALRREELKEIKLLKSEDEDRAKLAAKNLVFIRQEIDKQKSAIAENNAFYGDLIEKFTDPEPEKAVKAVTKALEKQAEQLKENPELLERMDERIKRIFAAFDTAFGSDFFPDFEEKVEDQLKAFDSQTEAMVKLNKDRLDQMREDEERYQDFLRDVRQAGFDFGSDLLSSFNQAQLNASDERLIRVQENRERELSLVGDNEDAKKALNKRFDEEEKRLQRQRANREKNLALFGIAVDTAEAVVKTGANLGYPLAIPFQAFAIATGALQAAVVQGAKFGFKDGVFDLDGPGTTKSDSIPARLSKGESVTPAEVTERFGWLLKPMIEDKSFDTHNLRALVDLNVPSQLRGDIMRPAAFVATDMRETNALLRKLNNKPTHSINVDKNGFSLHVREQQQYTEYVNTRYSMDV